MIRFHSFIREEEKVRSRKSVKCGKNTVLISPNSDELKEADIQPPAERLGAVTAIPADERAAAKARTLAKAAALRKKREEQKEEFEIEEDDDEELDEALTGERYKKAVKKPGGTAYSRMVSADPKKRATRGGRGGESDFGAGDRGSGNKAARRAGTYKDKED